MNHVTMLEVIDQRDIAKTQPHSACNNLMKHYGLTPGRDEPCLSKEGMRCLEFECILGFTRLINKRIDDENNFNNNNV